MASIGGRTQLILAGALLAAAMALPYAVAQPEAETHQPGRRPAAAQVLEAATPRPGPRFEPEGALGEAVFLSQEIGPRPGGSAAERAAAQHVRSRLKTFGYRVGLQNGISLPDRPGSTANVIARGPGAANRPRIVLGAHLDSRAGDCPGANDNASGVGVVMEVARAMAETPGPVTLEVVLFGAEECGPSRRSEVGANAYVAAGLHAASRDTGPVIAMVSADMVGIGDQLWLQYAGARPDVLAGALSRSGRAVGVRVHTRRARPASDHGPFTAVGVPSLWLWSGADPRNHSPADGPEHLRAASLQRAGALLVHFLTHLQPSETNALSKRYGIVTQASPPGSR